ncbi:uncharacterized protein N7500_006221 [Penicillium coprophilum]|uniref:uncharacterized protein n=1 Tax=Penicillium coprophilum TaxID=36646 RepID=UPI002389CF88|nr:uncharacterized protein N7500_006221 [Penicillium coprophilum]KAJ5164391.1 hypothetical protein N7500_006221 [Penicillium coprophilum]
MSLDSLPVEVICLIASNLPRYKDKLSLVRCNHMLHDAAIYVLHKQDSLTANYALRWLLSRGFELGIQKIISRNRLDLNKAVVPRYTSINTPLLLAVGFGRSNIVELLLRNGAEVNLATDISALEYAATLGDYNMTSLLLKHGAHVDRVGAKRGLTPLGCALELGYAIREANPYFRQLDTRHDLSRCKAENEFVAVIQLLLAHGADSHFQSDQESQSTCLHRIPGSPWKSTEKLLGLFLASGANLNAQDWTGNTPLHIALAFNAFPADRDVQKEYVALLLKSGADVHLQNWDGEVPLGIWFENPGLWESFLKPAPNTRCHSKKGDKLIWTLLKVTYQKQTKHTRQHFINNLLIEILVEHGALGDKMIDDEECPLDLRAAGLYPVLKDLKSKRRVASTKTAHRKTPQKNVSKALIDSGSIRKATAHKKTRRPTKRLPPRTPKA